MEQKEIQWVGVNQTKDLESHLQYMIRFMIDTKNEIVTFFLDYENDGYMIQAYDDFDWFEVTSKQRSYDE